MAKRKVLSGSTMTRLEKKRSQFWSLNGPKGREYYRQVARQAAHRARLRKMVGSEDVLHVRPFKPLDDCTRRAAAFGGAPVKMAQIVDTLINSAPIIAGFTRLANDVYMVNTNAEAQAAYADWRAQKLSVTPHMVTELPSKQLNVTERSVLTFGMLDDFFIFRVVPTSKIEWATGPNNSVTMSHEGVDPVAVMHPDTRIGQGREPRGSISITRGNGEPMVTIPPETTVVHGAITPSNPLPESISFTTIDEAPYVPKVRLSDSCPQIKYEGLKGGEGRIWPFMGLPKRESFDMVQDMVDGWISEIALVPVAAPGTDPMTVEEWAAKLTEDITNGQTDV